MDIKKDFDSVKTWPMRFKADLSSVLPSYILHFIIVMFSEIIAVSYLMPGREKIDFEQIFKGLSAWDGSWYRYIVSHGYPTSQSTAFFPLYPYIWRIAERVLAPIISKLHVYSQQDVNIIVGLFISNFCYLIASYYLFKIVCNLYSKTIALRTVMFLAIFPTSFYFSVTYTEALFLMLTCASFYYGYRKSWLISGVLVGLSSLTRNLGAFTVMSLILIFYKSLGEKKFSLKNLFNLVKITLVPAAIFSLYPLYLFRKFRNPLEFMVAEKFWDRHFAFPWMALIPRYSPIDYFFTLAFTIILICSFKKLKFELWVYMLLNMLIPLSSVINGDPLSIPRYVVVIFPAFIYLAMVIRSRLTQNAYITASILFLSVFTGIFANVKWIA